MVAYRCYFKDKNDRFVDVTEMHADRLDEVIRQGRDALMAQPVRPLGVACGIEVWLGNALMFSDET